MGKYCIDDELFALLCDIFKPYKYNCIIYFFENYHLIGKKINHKYYQAKKLTIFYPVVSKHKNSFAVVGCFENPLH